MSSLNLGYPNGICCSPDHVNWDYMNVHVVKPTVCALTMTSLRLDPQPKRFWVKRFGVS